TSGRFPMRPLSLRRSGALVLFALLSVGCTETVAGPERGVEGALHEGGVDGGRAYQGPAALVGRALTVGHEAVLQARAQGLGSAEVRTEGERAVQHYLAGQGIEARFTG